MNDRMAYPVEHEEEKYLDSLRSDVLPGRVCRAYAAFYRLGSLIRSCLDTSTFYPVLLYLIGDDNCRIHL